MKFWHIAYALNGILYQYGRWASYNDAITWAKYAGIGDNYFLFQSIQVFNVN